MTHVIIMQGCQAQMQGKTTSWDLGSLLIKPVQRVLKYPLLLRVCQNFVNLGLIFVLIEYT